jgi:hypothetical protein
MYNHCTPVKPRDNAAVGLGDKAHRTIAGTTFLATLRPAARGKQVDMTFSSPELPRDRKRASRRLDHRDRTRVCLPWRLTAVIEYDCYGFGGTTN